MKKKLGFIFCLLTLGIVFLGVGINFLVDYASKQNPYIRPERRYYLYWHIYDEEETMHYDSTYDEIVFLEEKVLYKIEIYVGGGPTYINIDSLVFDYDNSFLKFTRITPYDPEYPTECEVIYLMTCKKKTTGTLFHLYLDYYEKMKYPEDYYRTINIIIE